MTDRTRRIAVYLVLCLLACALATPAAAQRRGGGHQRRPREDRAPQKPLIRDEHFQSAALGREMKYRIYLPHNYPDNDHRYPVLYLLHGLYGNFENWDKLTHLSTYTTGMNWIIVMPDADNSWYSNSAT